MGMFSKIFRTDGAVARVAIEQVAVYRSSGELEAGWRVDGVQDNTVYVSAGERSMRLPMADVLKANPALLTGRTLRIQQGSGEFEADWQAVSLWGDEHVKLKKLGRASTVSLQQIVDWNDWGTSFARAA